MGTVRKQLIKPIESSNGDFKCEFQPYTEDLNRGIVGITFLKSNKSLTCYFEIDSPHGKDILRISGGGLLIKRAEKDGFDGALNMPLDEAIHYLKFGISDPNAAI
jgi:hypothetical protein